MKMENWRGSWFQARDRAFTIEQLLPRGGGFYRDLAPQERALGAFILPPFQRPAVWSEDQQIKLVESILDGLPIPPYVVNRDMDGDYRYDRWLLDGQQRITAILAFIDGQFSVRGQRYEDVSQRDQYWFLSRPLHCLETELTDEGLLKEIYNRLAYGGTPHVAKSL